MSQSVTHLHNIVVINLNVFTDKLGIVKHRAQRGQTGGGHTCNLRKDETECNEQWYRLKIT